MSEHLERALAAPLDDVNDAGAATVRDYLRLLLARLWTDGEGFSGKRPFGNSGWQWDVYEAFVKAGLIPGSIDHDGYLDDVDEERADALVLACIDHMCRHAPHTAPLTPEQPSADHGDGSGAGGGAEGEGGK